MSSRSAAGLRQHLGHLATPRIERTKEHQLIDIVIIALCATIAGADGWVANAKSMINLMTFRHYRRHSRSWYEKVASSPLMPWAAKPRLPKRLLSVVPITF